MANDPAAWHDFYVMSGGAAAALTGLVFVGLSLHAQAIMGIPFYRNRAVTAVLSLVTQLLLAAAMLIPGQSLTALGLEIETAALVFLGVAIWSVVYRGPAAGAVAMPRHRWAVELAAGVPWNATFIAAGLFLLTHTNGGLYVLAGHMLLAFCWNIYVALVLVAEVAEAPAT